jgi:hypothetical protein
MFPDLRRLASANNAGGFSHQSRPPPPPRIDRRIATWDLPTTNFNNSSGLPRRFAQRVPARHRGDRGRRLSRCVVLCYAKSRSVSQALRFLAGEKCIFPMSGGCHVATHTWYDGSIDRRPLPRQLALLNECCCCIAGFGGVVTP